jgi:hypothetical protein
MFQRFPHRPGRPSASRRRQLQIGDFG